LPQDPESYVHRIGRTGRAGKEGTAWSFVTPREIDHLHFIEKVTRQKIAKKPLPSIAEAIEGKQRVTAERILEFVENDAINEFKAIAIQMLDQYDSVNLLASAIKLITGEKKDVNIELTPEDPIRAKKRKPDVRTSGRRFSGGNFGGGNRSGSGSSSSGPRGRSDSGRGGYSGGGRSSSASGSSTGGYNRDRDASKPRTEGRSEPRRSRPSSDE